MGDACDPCLTNSDAACLPVACVDNDRDGYGPQGASNCAGGASNFDCADNDATRHPGLFEACDGIDNNCDGRADEQCFVPAYR